MKREELEKSAILYADDENRNRKHGIVSYSAVDFIAGAEWRIDSVWHDINKEKPQDGKQCLLEITYKNGYVPTII